MKKMIKDGHHVYEMMVVENTNQDIQYNQEDMMFGQVLRKNKDELFIRYWQKTISNIFKDYERFAIKSSKIFRIRKTKTIN